MKNNKASIGKRLSVNGKLFRVQIYTGDGKGKTTAAFGLALRTLGAGKSVAIIQFMKKGDSSEIKAIKKYKLPIDVFCFGIGFYKILNDKHTKKEHRKVIEQALKKAKRIIEQGKHDLIILDEILVAISLGLIEVNLALKLVSDFKNGERFSVNGERDIILTGRNAPKELIRVADLVTEMKQVKHYFDKDVKARKGIEF